MMLLCAHLRSVTIVRETAPPSNEEILLDFFTKRTPHRSEDMPPSVGRTIAPVSSRSFDTTIAGGCSALRNSDRWSQSPVHQTISSTYENDLSLFWVDNWFNAALLYTLNRIALYYLRMDCRERECMSCTPFVHRWDEHLRMQYTDIWANK